MIKNLRLQNLMQLKMSLSAIIFISIVFLCALINDGFMGTDEYWTGITRYLPAQSTSPSGFLQPEDVKSPLQMIPFWIAAKVGYTLGLDDPYHQYRFMLVIIGLAHALIMLAGFYLLKAEGYKINESFKLPVVFAFCYFIPFILTRPMFESLTAPWLFIAAICAWVYDTQHSAFDQNKAPGIVSSKLSQNILIVGTVCVCIAFLLRPQVGTCALIFPLLTLRHKNMRHLYLTAGIGLGLFVLIGLMDAYFVGRFHGSLRSLIEYNLSHGSEYGNQSVATYPGLLFTLGLIPWFLYKDSVFFKKEYWRSTWVWWAIIAIFVVTHSVIAQKFERFLIPVLPIYFLALCPLIANLWAERKLHRFRWRSLLAFNLFLWFFATWFAPQNNIIEVSRYIHDHPEIKKVMIYKKVPDWIPEIFIDRKDVKVSEVSNLAQINAENCDPSEAILLGKTVLGETEGLVRWKVVEKFSPNPIDNLAYHLNPAKNLRRAPLLLLQCL
ncbi:MAG: hypothetical protein V4736_16105 [Bdellovibrionota bacterium]